MKNKKVKVQKKRIKKQKINRSINKNNMSIKAKLILFFIILSVIPAALVGFYSYSNSEKSIKNKVALLSEELSKQNSELLETKLKEVERSMDIILGDIELVKLLVKKEYKDSFEKFQDYQSIKKKFTTLALSYKDISSITVYMNNEEILEFGTTKVLQEYLKKDEFKNSQEFKNVMNGKGEGHWVTGLNGQYDKVYLMRQVKYNGPVGMLIYEMNLDIISKIFNNVKLGENSWVLITNSLGNIVYHQNNEEIGSALSEEYSKKIFEDKEKNSSLWEII